MKRNSTIRISVFFLISLLIHGIAIFFPFFFLKGIHGLWYQGEEDIFSLELIDTTQEGGEESNLASSYIPKIISGQPRITNPPKNLLAKTRVPFGRASKLGIKSPEILSRMMESVLPPRSPLEEKSKTPAPELKEIAKEMNPKEVEKKEEDVAKKRAEELYPREEREDIAKEVAKVFKGEHGELPQLAPGGLSLFKDKASIKIKNETSYNLSLFFSGPVDLKISIPPGEIRIFPLAPGKYKIAAKVDDLTVIPYAGKHKYKEREYKSKFYIEEVVMKR